MGRSKLEDDKKRRRYTFYLTPRAGDLIDWLTPGERGRFVSAVLEAEIDRLGLILGGSTRRAGKIVVRSDPSSPTGVRTEYVADGPSESKAAKKRGGR